MPVETSSSEGYFEDATEHTDAQELNEEELERVTYYPNFELVGVTCNAHAHECSSIRDKLEPTPPILRFTVAYYRSPALPITYPFHFALTSSPVFCVPG